MPPTNRELNTAVENLKSHFNEKLGDVQREINTLAEQVRKTNGRVKTLELWRAAILGMISLIIVGGPVFLALYNAQRKSVNEVVQQAIKESLLSQVEIVGVGEAQD